MFSTPNQDNIPAPVTVLDLSTISLPELSELECNNSSGLPHNNSADQFIMAKNIQCTKFAGYPHENAQKFISEFNSYSTFMNLNGDENRKIAAFHLHLKGPAITWFNSLSDEIRCNWENLLESFKERFIVVDGPSPTLFREMENFQSLKLMEGQPI